VTRSLLGPSNDRFSDLTRTLLPRYLSARRHVGILHAVHLFCLLAHIGGWVGYQWDSALALQRQMPSLLTRVPLCRHNATMVVACRRRLFTSSSPSTAASSSVRATPHLLLPHCRHFAVDSLTLHTDVLMRSLCPSIQSPSIHPFLLSSSP
jgi:hypothetical protein